MKGEPNWQPLSAPVFLQYYLMLCICEPLPVSYLQFWVKENKSEGSNLSWSGYNWKRWQSSLGFHLFLLLKLLPVPENQLKQLIYGWGEIIDDGGDRSCIRLLQDEMMFGSFVLTPTGLNRSGLEDTASKYVRLWRPKSHFLEQLNSV